MCLKNYSMYLNQCAPILRITKKVILTLPIYFIYVGVEDKHRSTAHFVNKLCRAVYAMFLWYGSILSMV